MPCPRCASTTTRKRAARTQLSYRTFTCRSRQHTFNERTGTPFNSLTFPSDIVLQVVLWRLRDKLSLRDLAEMFLERGRRRVHWQSDGNSFWTERRSYRPCCWSPNVLQVLNQYLQSTTREMW